MHAQTFSHHAVLCAAGLATLRALTPSLHARIEARTARLVSGLVASAARYDVPFTASHAGSMFGFFFQREPVRDFAGAKGSDVAFFKRFFHAARERGVYLAPSAFEAAFKSAAHTDADVQLTVERLDEALGAALAAPSAA